MKLTNTNLFALKSLFATADKVSNRIERTTVAHIKRCIALGLVSVDGEMLTLTDAGKAAVK